MQAWHFSKGTIDVGFAELEPYRGPNGAITTLADTIFSTVPGAPVFVGKACVTAQRIPRFACVYLEDRLLLLVGGTVIDLNRGAKPASLGRPPVPAVFRAGHT